MYPFQAGELERYVEKSSAWLPAIGAALELSVAEKDLQVTLVVQMAY